MPSNSFKKYQIDSINIIRKLAKFEKQLDNISLIISKKIKNGGKILTCGNGGSSCDAQHLVAELVVRLKAENDRKSIPALFLGMDLATMTACGNDFGYD
ncbi:MAG: phosphoheptose isomerase, partial [Euryarchaeota archaeon]|nr:phosphoheptose isomerase [Euryarchaeota archaeon]